MRTLLALSVLTTSLLPACLACGFEGEGDTMYLRDIEALLVCANGGFVQLGETTYVEGRTYSDAGGLRGATGETGALAFQAFTMIEDGTFGSPELGAGWSVVEQSAWDRDHAHVLCADLEARAWWSSAVTLPKTTTFANGLATITLTTDGAATVKRGATATTGAYALDAGIGHVAVDGAEAAAIYTADGTLWIAGVGYARVDGATVRE